MDSYCGDVDTAWMHNWLNLVLILAVVWIAYFLMKRGKGSSDG